MWCVVYGIIDLEDIMCLVCCVFCVVCCVCLMRFVFFVVSSVFSFVEFGVCRLECGLLCAKYYVWCVVCVV